MMVNKMNRKTYLGSQVALVILISSITLPVYATQNTGQSITITSNKETVLQDGTKILTDGTAVLPDGTKMLPNGDVILPDGTVLKAE
jgi:hypothetical protein